MTPVAPRIVNDISYAKKINHDCHFAIFGEGGMSFFVAGTALRAILGDSRSAKCCIFPYKMRLQDATSKVSEAAGEMTISWSDHRRIVFTLAEANQRVSAEILT